MYNWKEHVIQSGAIVLQVGFILAIFVVCGILILDHIFAQKVPAPFWTGLGLGIGASWIGFLVWGRR